MVTNISLPPSPLIDTGIPDTGTLDTGTLPPIVFIFLFLVFCFFIRLFVPHSLTPALGSQVQGFVIPAIPSPICSELICMFTIFPFYPTYRSSYSYLPEVSMNCFVIDPRYQFFAQRYPPQYLERLFLIVLAAFSTICSFPGALPGLSFIIRPALGTTIRILEEIIHAANRTP